MAKILFIVNEHKNEAFAMPVARATAKQLRKEGHEVLWRKIKPKERTPRVLSEYSGGKVDVVYHFHCTPHDYRIWRTHKADFLIFNASSLIKYSIPPTPARIVEIKAHYKPFLQTTSHKLTLEAGLNPAEFSEAIAGKIKEDVAAKFKMAPRETVLRGRIPRRIDRRTLAKFEPKTRPLFTI